MTNRVKWEVEDLDKEDPWIEHNQITDNQEQMIHRKCVIGGWLIYRDILNEENGDIILSTVVFVKDEKHEWIIEK